MFNKVKKIITAVFLIGFLIQTVPASASTAMINVDFNTPGKTISSNFCGTNAKGGTVNQWLGDYLYAQKTKYVNSSIVRFHDSISDDSAVNWRGWMDNQGYNWNRWKISVWANEVRKLGSQGINPEIMVTIPTYYSWMKTIKTYDSKNKLVSTVLDPSEYNSFAFYANELVKIITIEEKINLKYLQITNELDFDYNTNLIEAGLPSKAGMLADLAIFTAKSLKSNYPNLKLGAPALARPDSIIGLDLMFDKFKNDGNKLFDFLGFHYYLTGSVFEDDNSIYNKSSGTLQYHFGNISSKLNQRGLGYITPILGEFNINWSGIDPRMQNMKGAIVDGLTFIEAAKLGVQTVMPWADMDNNFGRWDESFNDRPVIHVGNICSRFLNGTVYDSTSTDNNVQTLSLINKNGQKTVVFINRSSNPIKIQVNGVNPGANFNWYQLDSTANYVREYTPNGYILNNLDLPANSISVAVL